MNTKESVLEAVKDLPDGAAIEDAMERLLFLAKIQRGIERADAGETITQDNIKVRLGI